MPEVRLIDIEKRFGPVVAVTNVDLTIEDKEYVTILGPSGCGKTTLIKMIAGIWEPTRGRITIDGVDMKGVPIEERSLGYVFQNIALFPHLNVLDNVSYGPRVRVLGKEYVEEVPRRYLSMVNLLDKMGMFPSELAGGEQQKVSLARALSSGAKLLLLDEPLSALDARVRMDLRYELRRLAKDLGLTVIHVTHDQEEAMSVSDRIVLMRNGMIVEINSPEMLYKEPRTIFSANFVGETNLIEGRVVGTDKFTEVSLRDGTILKLERGGFSKGEAVVISVRPENVYPSDSGMWARIIGSIFMGTYLRVTAQTEGDDIVEFDFPVSEDKVFSEGDNVWLQVNARMAILFRSPVEGIEEAVKLE
jgi:ABC-type Fe3+/spermidine/putrescine transport system ATPase subunit